MLVTVVFADKTVLVDGMAMSCVLPPVPDPTWRAIQFDGETAQIERAGVLKVSGADAMTLIRPFIDAWNLARAEDDRRHVAETNAGNEEIARMARQFNQPAGAPAEAGDAAKA